MLGECITMHVCNRPILANYVHLVVIVKGHYSCVSHACMLLFIFIDERMISQVQSSFVCTIIGQAKRAPLRQGQ